MRVRCFSFARSLARAHFISHSEYQQQQHTYTHERFPEAHSFHSENRKFYMYRIKAAANKITKSMNI